MLAIDGLNVYDVLNYQELVMTSKTAKAIEARLAERQSRSGDMSSPESLILAPIITEKGTMASEKASQVVFRVRPGAGKDKIREAIEHLFKVTVIKFAPLTSWARNGKKAQSRAARAIGKRHT